MQVEIKIDSAYTEPKLIILTDSMTEEINDIIKKLSAHAPQIISGSKDQRIEVLEETDLIRVYANTGKVYAVTSNGEYMLRLRLYEIEEKLNMYLGAMFLESKKYWEYEVKIVNYPPPKGSGLVTAQS